MLRLFQPIKPSEYIAQVAHRLDLFTVEPQGKPKIPFSRREIRARRVKRPHIHKDTCVVWSKSQGLLIALGSVIELLRLLKSLPEVFPDRRQRGVDCDCPALYLFCVRELSTFLADIA